jgi:peptidoglycan/LPS O-acetylase OafA/YrhL
MKYRAEIDGLRALAVVPVILFHAGFELFSGGFVGVDVFFVISGYLITTILIEDFENQRFSLVSFYERRARRILPALFFVMLVCIPFAWMWMFPSQMKDFSQSLVAVSLFASNILFWHESGYFDAAAEENPLVHTWSLAVEEQYYLLFPIFLILTWRFGKNKVFWTIVVMAAISLLISEWGWRNNATANFYLAPTRAWELLAGSIAAFIVQKQGVQKNNFLAMLGLSAIIFSIFFYDKTTPFPSVYSLVPVLGVVLLVLYADKETLAAKLLSTKGFVGIGLISYSAYLWHQPLFAFARIRSLEHPSLLLMLVLSSLSILLAYFSWRYIEKPFRNKHQLSKVKIFVSSAVLLASFTMFGLVGYFNKGFPSRFDVRILDVLKVNKLEKELRDDGGCNRHQNEVGIEACTYGATEEVSIALIGDSHASTLVSALDFYGRENSFGFVRHTKNGCPFVLEFQSTSQDNCFNFVSNVFVWLRENSHVNTIFISHRLQYYINNFNYENTLGGVEQFGTIFYGTINTLNESSVVRRNAILSSFENTIRLLAGEFPSKKIIIATPTPEHAWHVPQQVARQLLFDRSVSIPSLPLSVYSQRNEEIFPVITDLSELPNVSIYPLHTNLCADDGCISELSGAPLYYDDDHLAYQGGLAALSEFIGSLNE